MMKNETWKLEFLEALAAEEPMLRQLNAKTAQGTAQDNEKIVLETKGVGRMSVCDMTLPWIGQQ